MAGIAPSKAAQAVGLSCVDSGMMLWVLGSMLKVKY